MVWGLGFRWFGLAKNNIDIVPQGPSIRQIPQRLVIWRFLHLEPSYLGSLTDILHPEGVKMFTTTGLGWVLPCPPPVTVYIRGPIKSYI